MHLLNLEPVAPALFFATRTGPVLFRTLDYSFPFLRDCVIQLNVRKSVSMYQNISFLGYVGAYTVVKPGSFALSLNYRDAHDDHDHGKAPSILQWIYRIQKSIYRPLRDSRYEMNGCLIRALCDDEKMTYTVLVDKLEFVLWLVAPCYLTLVGLTRACRIIRDREPSLEFTVSMAPIWRRFMDDIKRQWPKLSDLTYARRLRCRYQRSNGRYLHDSLFTQRHPRIQEAHTDFMIQTNITEEKVRVLDHLIDMYSGGSKVVAKDIEAHLSDQSQGVLRAYSRFRCAENVLKGEAHNSLFAKVESLLVPPILNRNTIFVCVLAPQQGSAAHSQAYGW